MQAFVPKWVGGFYAKVGHLVLNWLHANWALDSWALDSQAPGSWGPGVRFPTVRPKEMDSWVGGPTVWGPIVRL